MKIYSLTQFVELSHESLERAELVEALNDALELIKTHELDTSAALDLADAQSQPLLMDIVHGVCHVITTYNLE